HLFRSLIIAASVVGWAKSPAAADDMARSPRAALPTRSSGEVGRRGQRRMTVRTNYPVRCDAPLPTLQVILRHDAGLPFSRLAHRADDRSASVSGRSQPGDAVGGATLRNAGQQSARGLRIEQQGACRLIEVATDDAAGGKILRQQCRDNSVGSELARAQ